MRLTTRQPCVLSSLVSLGTTFEAKSSLGMWKSDDTARITSKACEQCGTTGSLAVRH